MQPLRKVAITTPTAVPRAPRPHLKLLQQQAGDAIPCSTCVFHRFCRGLSPVPPVVQEV
jgi:hypothetical protein